MNQIQKMQPVKLYKIIKDKMYIEQQLGLLHNIFMYKPKLRKMDPKSK